MGVSVPVVAAGRPDFLDQVQVHTKSPEHIGGTEGREDLLIVDDPVAVGIHPVIVRQGQFAVPQDVLFEARGIVRLDPAGKGYFAGWLQAGWSLHQIGQEERGLTGVTDPFGRIVPRVQGRDFWQAPNDGKVFRQGFFQDEGEGFGAFRFHPDNHRERLPGRDMLGQEPGGGDRRDLPPGLGEPKNPRQQDGDGRQGCDQGQSSGGGPNRWCSTVGRFLAGAGIEEFVNLHFQGLRQPLHVLPFDRGVLPVLPPGNRVGGDAQEGGDIQLGEPFRFADEFDLSTVDPDPAGRATLYMLLISHARNI